jgi:hypothetical protein
MRECDKQALTTLRLTVFPFLDTAGPFRPPRTADEARRLANELNAKARGDRARNEQRRQADRVSADRLLRQAAGRAGEPASHRRIDASQVYERRRATDEHEPPPRARSFGELARQRYSAAGGSGASGAIQISSRGGRS